MPSAVVKSLAKKTHKSVNDVEKLWKKAKAIAAKTYSPDSPNYYALVVGILKKMLGMKR